MITSLLCLNVEAINSNQTSGPFDIPAKTPLDDTTPRQRELQHLRSGAQHNQLGDEFVMSAASRPLHSIPVSKEEKDNERKLRTKRTAERRAKAKEIIMEHQPDVGQLQRMSQEEIKTVYGTAIKDDPLLEKADNRWARNLGGQTELVDPGGEYDEWSQGYRMLGGFIDCDNQKDQGSGDGDGGCSRWMMWAAYINPNYQGGGRSEYFSNNYYYGGSTTSSLDCHSSNTEWQLLGVYRQEFYQFIEQISKHLWAIDDYEYVAALAGLAYMTDDDCYGVGYDNNGNYLYAGVRPIYQGKFEMGLYTDATCLTLTDSGATFDDFGLTSDMDLGSKDDGSLSDDELSSLYGYWQNTQEYTLELLNEVYDQFKYCTLCMDYPTYQDGYFIGDYGTDDDDLINQCWKFLSHDSFTCEADCVALGDAQGTITKIDYLGTSYGQSWDGSSGGSSSSSSSGSGSSSSSGSGYQQSGSENSFSRFKANAFLTLNGVLFIATFLAFSVARGTRDSVDSAEKKRSLLSKEERRAARSPKSSKSSGSRKSSKSAKSRKSAKSVSSRNSKTSRSSSKPKSSSRTTGGSSARSKSRTRSSSGNRSSSRTQRSPGTYA